MQNITLSSTIKSQILLHQQGWVFSAHDLTNIDVDRGTVDVVLHRLAKQGVIRRLGYGLYDIPHKSSILGDLSPDIDTIISAYSRRMGQVFVLDPLNAANALGLTTQVPVQLTYLTDGKSHNLNICSMRIRLIHASPKIIRGADSSVGIFIQALRYFGAKGAPDQVIDRIARRLSPDDLFNLCYIKNKVMRNLSSQIDRIEKSATIH
jgi:predicted transcriptional regulator of viral defense system